MGTHTLGSENKQESTVARTGLDGVALKPTECAVGRGAALETELLVIDYEGPAHLPDRSTLTELRDSVGELRVTTPVRADGCDPLGESAFLGSLPAGTKRVLVAGNGAYLDAEERKRAIAPRLRAARQNAPDAWVGTEGIERLALAAGGPQFELLSRSTAGDVRSLRAAGFEGDLVVYAPVVLSEATDTVLDAVGAYTARRRPVARALPAESETDHTATGRAREVLAAATRDYALCGTPSGVSDQIRTLKDAGVDRVVGYPARGIEAFGG